MSGLAEQMLATVVGNEVPELESQRQELVQRMSDGRLMLKVKISNPSSTSAPLLYAWIT